MEHGKSFRVSKYYSVELFWYSNLALQSSMSTGFETLGQIVEELKNPTKNFVRAMVILLIMSIMTYLIAFFGAVGLEEQYDHWTQGYYAILAEKVTAVE